MLKTNEADTILKNKKIESIRLHAGVAVGPIIINSATVGKKNVVSLHLLSFGVLVIHKNGPSVELNYDAVPFSDILSVRFIEKDEEEKVDNSLVAD